MRVKLTAELLIAISIFLMLGIFPHFNFVVLFLAILLLIINHKLQIEQQAKASFEIESLYAIEKISCLLEGNSDICPDWLKFPDRSRVIWLNSIVKCLWDPHLKLGVERIVNETLGQIINENKPKFLGNVYFKFANLGPNPPVISSVKLSASNKCVSCAHDHSVGKNSHFCNSFVWLDFVMIMGSEKMSIVFGTKASNLFAIDNIQMKITARLSICDFVNAFPGFSKIKLSLLEQPDINYDVSAFNVQLSSFPMLKRWFNKFIVEGVANCTFPNFVPLDITNETIEYLFHSGKVLLDDRELDQHGFLRLFINRVEMDVEIPKNSKVYVLAKTQEHPCLKTAGFFESSEPRKELTFNDAFIFRRIPHSNSVQLFVINEGAENGVDRILGQCAIKINEYALSSVEENAVKPLLNPVDLTQTGTVVFNFFYEPPVGSNKSVDTEANNGAESNKKTPTMKTIIMTKEMTNSIYLVKVSINGVLVSREKPTDLRLYIKIGEFCQKTNKFKYPIDNIKSSFDFQVPNSHPKTLTLFLFEFRKLRGKLIGKKSVYFGEKDHINSTWYKLSDSLPDSELDSAPQLNVFIQCDKLTLPNRKKSFFARKVSENGFDIRQTESATYNDLIIDVIEAKGIRCLDKESLAFKTFVSVSVDKTEIKATQESATGLNPKWNQRFHFRTTESSALVGITLFNAASPGLSLKLSEVHIPVARLEAMQSIIRWHLLPAPTKSRSSHDLASRGDPRSPSADQKAPAKAPKDSFSAFRHKAKKGKLFGFFKSSASNLRHSEHSKAPVTEEIGPGKAQRPSPGNSPVERSAIGVRAAEEFVRAQSVSVPETGPETVPGGFNGGVGVGGVGVGGVDGVGGPGAEEASAQILIAVYCGAEWSGDSERSLNRKKKKIFRGASKKSVGGAAEEKVGVFRLKRTAAKGTAKGTAAEEKTVTVYAKDGALGYEDAAGKRHALGAVIRNGGVYDVGSEGLKVVLSDGAAGVETLEFLGDEKSVGVFILKIAECVG